MKPVMRVNAEKIILFITLGLAIVAAGAELVGIEGFWLTRRLPAFTLLVLSSLAISVLLFGDRVGQALHRQGDRLERIESATGALVEREPLLAELHKLWGDREPVVDAFMARMSGLAAVPGTTPDAVVDELGRAMTALCEGKLEGRGQRFPWDATICAIDLDRQTFLYHPSAVMIGRAVLPRFESNFGALLADPTRPAGTGIIVSRRTSEQLLGLVKDPGWTCLRFSKVYFRVLDRLRIAVVFESHLNIVHQLPDRTFLEHDT